MANPPYAQLEVWHHRTIKGGRSRLHAATQKVDTTPFTVSQELPTSTLPKTTPQDRLEAAHQEFLGKTLTITVPENFTNEKPIIITNHANGASFDHIHIVAQPHSKTVFVEESGANPRFTKVTIEVKENADITFGSKHQGGVLWAKREATVHKGGNMRWCDVIKDTELAYSRTKTILQGDHSQTSYAGVFVGEHGQYDIDAVNEHVGKNTKSDLVSKGVLEGTAKAINQGTITIQENASGSDGYQKEDILLLSEGAEADAIPKLFIRNHDVKCSHGASVAPVNPQHLYYLQSRGVGERKAKDLIIQGFLNTALQTMPKELQ